MIIQTWALPIGMKTGGKMREVNKNQYDKDLKVI